MANRLDIAPRPGLLPEAWEFFAGGGLAGLGLDGFRIGLANDIDAMKARAFRANHPGVPLIEGDVWRLDAADLSGAPDLLWASSPCQDVSLAGARGGLEARRSGAFWGFWKLVEGLKAEGRAPRAIVIENVVGLLTSGGGRDFAAVCTALVEGGWRVGGLELDAALWLPQSRPRLFLVALRDAGAPETAGPGGPFHSPRLVAAQSRLPEATKAAWAWWSLPAPRRRNTDLATILIPDAEADWLSPARVEALLARLAPLHRARLDQALAGGERRVGAAYRRVRSERGVKTQRLELRFDGLAGCLRTPAGGSSRQYVIVTEGGRVRVRLLTGREAARLMGVADSYRLPGSESAALKLMGDAVAVPAVRALSRNLLIPALTARRKAA
jgi:DNA (cytosine-5)-methyltransferase 1